MLVTMSNVFQTLLRETVGFDPIISLLKLRGVSYRFTEQKVGN